MFGRSRRMDILYAGSGAGGRVTRDPVSSNCVRRPGPPAVAMARHIYADRDDVAFASLETAFRADGADLLVRAWVRIPADQIPPPVVASLDAIAGAFASDPLLHKVFFLSASYHLGVGEIARLLGLSRWRIRSALRRAIARLDRASRERVSDPR